MLPLLIIKCGSAYASVRNKYGDFDKLIIQSLPYINNEVIVLTAQHQPNYLKPENYCGIIITGAHEDVTDRAPWMLHLESWLKELPKSKVPVLGICFGHQIIANALGGRIERNKHGGEFGIAQINIYNDKNSQLLKNMPSNFMCYVSYSQSVTELPEKSESLAKNEVEENHIVKYSDIIFGLQFHPEFNYAIARYYNKKSGRPNLIGGSLLFKNIQMINRQIMLNFSNLCNLSY